MQRDVIIACDFKNEEELMVFLNKFQGKKPYLKIGMELFYGTGTELVKKIKGMGFKIFLDLKLHDIPNTVKSAMKNIAKLGVDMVNLHATGGINMMKAANEGLEEGAKEYGMPKPMLIAVTILTSLDQDMLTNEVLIKEDLNEAVRKYAQNAQIAGLDGVVCSPLEASMMKEMGLVSVTPGIRFADGSADDQKRITTPSKAKEIGSTYIVVGRAITGAVDPVAQYERCVEEFVK